MEELNDDEDNHYSIEKIVLYSYIIFISLLLIVTLYMSYHYIKKHFFMSNNLPTNHIVEIIPEKDRLYINKLLDNFINS